MKVRRRTDRPAAVGYNRTFTCAAEFLELDVEG